MKIALIRKNYTQFGGAENYLKQIARKLTAKNHNVTIFSSGKWPDNFSLRKVKTLRKPSFLSNILFALKSRTMLRQETFDCILSLERTFSQDIYRAGDGCHKEWLEKRGMIESPIKKASFSISPNHIVSLYLEKICFLNSGIIIANSKMVKSDITRHYRIPEEKIHVIYNGVDLSRFQPVTPEERTARKRALNINEEKVVLFIGADLKRKGLPVLLKAFSLLDTKNIRLIIAGKTPGSRYLAMVKELGIEKNVTFRGPEKNVQALYAAADVFVLPTIYDPFSNATIEAMASGLPVITTIYNGASELIENGVQGYAVKDPLNFEILAEKILSSLSHSEDMGRHARIKAAEYPVDDAIESILNIISGDSF